MRGEDEKQQDMFSYISPEQRVPADHPLRAVREMVDQILKEMSPRFARLYSDVGRPSIAPERLLRTLLLKIFYTIRSERLLVEQLNYILLRWFVGMNMDDEVWNHAVFSKKPRATAERRDRGSVLPASAGASAAVSVRRTLHRGWHVAGGVGRAEELSAQGWEGRVGRVTRSKLSRGEAAE